jgi:hypothetical protein
MYHPPSSDKVVMSHQEVRNGCALLASLMQTLLPDGREKSVVMTKIEETMFWANAAIARDPSNRRKPDADVEGPDSER